MENGRRQNFLADKNWQTSESLVPQDQAVELGKEVLGLFLAIEVSERDAVLVCGYMSSRSCLSLILCRVTDPPLRPNWVVGLKNNMDKIVWTGNGLELESFTLLALS